MTVDDVCFRCFRRVADPALRLICLPHAGGTASAYRNWHRWVPAGVEVVAVQYPGRQERLHEPPLIDMGRLVEHVAAAVRTLADRPFALFGHSMGAIVAFEVTRLLEATGHAPRLLAVSSQHPPRLYRPDTTVLGGDAALVAEVTRLGGADPEIFTHPELRDLVLPALRADFRMLAEFLPDPAARVSTPILACAGDQDADVSAAELAQWPSATMSTAWVRMWPGDHFYLIPHERALVADVVDSVPLADLIRAS